jgi:hypothetical protein
MSFRFKTYSHVRTKAELNVTAGGYPEYISKVFFSESEVAGSIALWFMSSANRAGKFFL